MKTDLVFRPYTPEDFDDCMSIFDGNCPKFFADHERQAFQKYLQEARYPYFVVTDIQNQILACGGFVTEKGIAELAWGMVRNDIHHQGVGRFLFTQRLDAIRKAGANAIIMDTSQHSLGFYQSLGFEVVGRKPDGYGPGLDRIDLRLDLDKEAKLEA